MKTEYLENELERSLKLLGLTEVTSNCQRNNGTSCWEFPLNHPVQRLRGLQIAEYTSGYVRNVNGGYSCYQINPTKSGEKKWWGTNGEGSWYPTQQILLPTRAERLARLVSYAIYQNNKIHTLT